MNVSRTAELAVGGFVALGLLAALMLALKVSDLGSIGSTDGYRLLARFDNIGSLKVRSPVTIAGVRVGRVSEIRYDMEDYRAVVTMTIEGDIDRIPADSAASILTAGLLGEQYIGLEPGGETRYLEDKDEISLTQPALLLEQIIGQFLFGAAAESGGTR